MRGIAATRWSLYMRSCVATSGSARMAATQERSMMATGSSSPATATSKIAFSTPALFRKAL